jgi:serine protease Do
MTKKIEAQGEARLLKRSRASLGAAFFIAVLAISAPVRAQSTPLSILEERAFQQAAAKAEASIVRIETVGGVDQIGESLVGHGPTSGVVVGSDGWIITSSFNFLSQPTSILVTVGEGQRYPAKLVAKDESRQLTLLKIEAHDLKTLQPVPREELRVGQWTIALGRTLEPSFPNISVGILSALNRISGKAVQTDARTSPVNYGGALVDLDGRCIGIIVPMSPDKDAVTAGVEWYDSGIGFAVPLVDILRVLDRLKAGETLKTGRIGILYPDKGLLTGEVKIDKVRPRSPAEAAGLQSGDVIIGVDGKEVDRAATLKQLVGPRYGGDSVVLKIRRGDETLEKPITLIGEIPPFELAFLGVLPERAPKKDSAPARIRAVIPGSPADKAGLKPGITITRVGDKKTPQFLDVVSALELEGPGDKVKLETSGSGDTSGEITLGSTPEAVPGAVPPAAIPTPKEAPKDRKLGRFVDSIEGDPRKYWAYVPEHYNSDYAYGLVVWLHPETDKREASTLKLWQPVCDERGLILVAPPAGNEAWSPFDVEFVLGVITKIQKQYTIDPARTVVVGEAEGGRLALFLGLAKRDVVSAAATISFVLPSRVPEVDPENPVRFHVSAFEDSPLASAAEKSLEPYRKEKYPLIFKRWKGTGEDGPTAETVDELGRWIDTLDGF